MQSFLMAVPASRRRSVSFSVAKRRVAAASPLLATTLLTAAIFLLPAPGVRHQAQAFAGQIGISNFSAAFE